jgi:hypothetical protein
LLWPDGLFALYFLFTDVKDEKVSILSIGTYLSSATLLSEEVIVAWPLLFGFGLNTGGIRRV